MHHVAKSQSLVNTVETCSQKVLLKQLSNNIAQSAAMISIWDCRGERGQTRQQECISSGKLCNL